MARTRTARTKKKSARTVTRPAEGPASAPTSGNHKARVHRSNDDVLSTEQNFRSLSLKDLLEARSLYHYHLMNKPNVVGTAVGLYLIRKKEPYPGETSSNGTHHDKGKRTFERSEVRRYSWPCVIAVVREWIDRSAFGRRSKGSAIEDMVPRTLFLPDGRRVPVCVVCAEPGEPDQSFVPDWHWPKATFGAGMPIVVESQSQELRATAGCLVSDGHTVYALTSRHVSATPGQAVFTVSSGKRVQIGVASDQQLTQRPFSDVYPELPSRKTFVNMDVGLIELADVNDWTSQVFGLGEVGELADLNEMNMTTRLIDAPVVAMGAASGAMQGRIKALFYRFRSRGGVDYVSDFLISMRGNGGKRELPRSATHPGDSGTVWHLVTRHRRRPGEKGWTEDDDFEGELRPIATQWGGQVFLEGTTPERLTFALATNLTNVCRELSVELVQEHNTGALPYWGQMGHYSIASFACGVLPNGKLRTFMHDNLQRISFSLAELSPNKIAEVLKKAKDDPDGFVPLADVPDIVWKNFPSKVVGGRDTKSAGQGRSTGPEHPTHYADVDDERDSDHRSLLRLSLDDPDNLSVEFWRQFYTDKGHTEQSKRGLLPFRVWQFFNEMEKFARQKKSVEFLCAAGLLSHYVGDACQPLHGSIYSDGYADRPTTITHHKRKTGEAYTTKSHVGAGVHSTYETKMIDRYAAKLVEKIKNGIGTSSNLPAIHTGKEAAVAILELMDRSAKRIQPTKLVDAFIDAGEKSTVAAQDALWAKYDKKTAACMIDGARVLAKIWAGAWAAGNGNAIAANKLGAIDPGDLKTLYEDRSFVESLDLDEIGNVLS